jgi:hypothetical protein
MKLAALALFDRRPELATREVARRVGMPPATAARLRQQLTTKTSRGAAADTSAAVRRDDELVEWEVLENGQVVRRRT